MIPKKARLHLISGVVFALLMIPLIAMQFTDTVNWSIFDFLIAGGLLLSAGLLIDFFLKNITSKKRQILITVFILIILIIVWMELAVGLFGTPFSGS